MEQLSGSRLRKEYDRLSAVTLFAYLYTEHIMRNTGVDELQARIKISRRNINNLRRSDDTTLMAESEKELRSLLSRVKEEREGASLRLNIENTNIMASGHIIYMANRRGKGGSNDRFPLLGLQNY